MVIDLNNVGAWLTIIGTLFSGIGALWVLKSRISISREKEKKVHDAALLQIAKESDSTIKSNLESKIKELDNKLNLLKESTEKDISHLRETYNSELRFLGEKIEELRKEVHSQHGQLVSLLTKMVDRD